MSARIQKLRKLLDDCKESTAVIDFAFGYESYRKKEISLAELETLKNKATKHLSESIKIEDMIDNFNKIPNLSEEEKEELDKIECEYLAYSTLSVSLYGALIDLKIGA